MAIHVFVDNSNVFGGAQRAAESLEPGVHWRAVRVYYRHLFQVVEGGRNAFTRVMSGSVPPGNDDLWAHAQSWGYQTDLLNKVEDDDGRLHEQGVDELLHLKIANTLLDFDGGTLVVVSGDGRLSDFGTGFAKQVERALKRGWAVEVWSWKAQLSGAYQRMTVPAGGSLQVKELDPFYRSVTFLRAGTYGPPHAPVLVKERVVAKLP